MKYLIYPILVFLFVLTLVGFWSAFMCAFKFIVLYQWFLCGLTTYFIVRRFSFFSRNELWLQTISHEVTHALVGLMFFHKIHSLEAYEDHGAVLHSGRKFGNMFISLAPYCLPLFTYVLLMLRVIGDDRTLYVFDVLIGFTLAFHLVCFWKQTGLRQPDIQQYGYFKAFLFIVVALLFNLTIVLLSIRKGIIGAFVYLFCSYWDDIVNWWSMIF